MPARQFDAVECLPCWSDINPRIGAAYDLFGTGKTAVKFNIGRYVGGEAVDIASANHPVNSSVNATNRTWNDANRNYVARLRSAQSRGKRRVRRDRQRRTSAATTRTPTGTTRTC